MLTLSSAYCSNLGSCAKVEKNPISNVDMQITLCWISTSKLYSEHCKLAYFRNHSIHVYIGASVTTFIKNECT